MSAINKGDRIRREYLSQDGKTVEKEEILTIKSIETFSDTTYKVEFEEQPGFYLLSYDEVHKQIVK